MAKVRFHCYSSDSALIIDLDLEPILTLSVTGQLQPTKETFIALIYSSIFFIKVIDYIKKYSHDNLEER